MRVTAKDVKQLLERFEACLRRLLTDEGRNALGEAVAGLKNAARDVPPNPGEEQDYPWEYRIFAAHPLRFTGCLPEEGCDIDVEVFCHVRGTGAAQGEQLAAQNVVVKVLVAGPKLFSAEQQASGVFDNPWKNAPDEKHVIARFHIDRAEEATGGKPVYHMQAGGTVQAGEVGICWPPEKLDVPRFPCLPLDLVLACELVLANFLPQEYDRLRKKPEWKGLVWKAEEFFVKPHLSMLQARASDPSRTETLLELVCDMSQGG